MKLGIELFINHDTVMTLTYFMARSIYVPYVLLLKCHLKEKNAVAENRQMNKKLIILTKNMTLGRFICPCPYHNIQTCLLVHVYIAISDEHLQNYRTIGPLVLSTYFSDRQRMQK